MRKTRKMRSAISLTAKQYGVNYAEAEQGIMETWEYICKNPDIEIRNFGIAMMEDGQPPSPEKITMCLTSLTLLCNTPPLLNEPDSKMRIHMAMQKIQEMGVL